MCRICAIDLHGGSKQSPDKMDLAGALLLGEGGKGTPIYRDYVTREEDIGLGMYPPCYSYTRRCLL